MKRIETINLNAAGCFRIRPIEPADTDAMRDIILETLVEHGAVGGGFASSDQDTRKMYEAFQQKGRIYFVVERINPDGTEGSADRTDGSLIVPPVVLGGAGIAPLPGEEGTCELVKMYFRKEIRGLGIGKRLLQICLDEAVRLGYSQIYLETIGQMHAARGLYEHLGFSQIPHSMGSTGHFSCDIFYFKKL